MTPHTHTRTHTHHTHARAHTHTQTYTYCLFIFYKSHILYLCTQLNVSSCLYSWNILRHTIQQEYVTDRIYYEDLTCLAPKTTGTIHSGSVDCILSSISMEWNFKRWRRGSPAPTQVQQITSAASRSSFSAAFFSIRYRFSSTDESSPVSSLSCCNFWSSVLL